jgi:Dna[CI] antecedent, DciA
MDGRMSKRDPAKPVIKRAEPEKPRGGRARAVAELLPDAGRAAFRRFGFVQGAVVSRWGEIVGTRYAGVSAPESIKFPHGQRTGGTLSLIVRGAHATMMQHIAPEIVERVNRPGAARGPAVAAAGAGRTGRELAHDRRSGIEGGAGSAGRRGCGDAWRADRWWE